MRINKTWLLSLLAIFPLLTIAQSHLQEPTALQLNWHSQELYLFMHFGPNTFTNEEWGSGKEKAEIFNPINLDCKQWCSIAKNAGAKAIIITAKHHDGFCLWPSKYSIHTVKESKWKNGKGDVLKELSDACKEYGLKFGVYISPWDRNHPDYGTEKYNDVFINMLKEVLLNYGPVWELWWDGANGEGPNGKKQVYDWQRFEKTVREISPNTLIFSDIGPDIRWCGNENGIAGKINWNTLDTAGFTRGAGAPAQDTLNSGNSNGRYWIPAECDVSIRPGWFWHKAEDDKVKTPEQLFDLYLKSIGRGANLLLNVPPNDKGLISSNDSAALIGFKTLRNENFSNNLLLNQLPKLENVITGKSGINAPLEYRIGTNISQKNTFIEYSFTAPQKINCIVLKERLSNGQKIKRISIRLEGKDGNSSFVFANTVGNKRILTFAAREVSRLTIIFSSDNDTKPYPVLYKPEAYLIDESLIEKK